MFFCPHVGFLAKRVVAAKMSRNDSNIMLQQLRQELLVLKQQLIAEKETSDELREELHDAQISIDAFRRAEISPARHMSERDDLRSRLVSSDPPQRHHGGSRTAADPHHDRQGFLWDDDTTPPSSGDEHLLLGGVFRASNAMPIRYVPPVDFLPAIFVEQYADVLAIVDRYAILYHRFHVGGGQRDPQLAVRDEDVQRSEKELLEARIRQLEADVLAKDESIAILKEQVVAWRTTGKDRAKFDAAVEDAKPAAKQTATLRNDDGDVSSSDDLRQDESRPRHRRAASTSTPSPSRRERRRPYATSRAGDSKGRADLPSPDHPSTDALPLRSKPNVFGTTPALARPLPAASHPNSNTLRPAASPFAGAPDLQGLYAPPRPLFGGEMWNPPAHSEATSLVPNVREQYAPGTASPLRHPWSDLMSQPS